MSNTEDIIRHLEQAQHDAAENKVVEEITESELEQISGAGGGCNDYSCWNRAFGR